MFDFVVVLFWSSHYFLLLSSERPFSSFQEILKKKKKPTKRKKQTQTKPETGRLVNIFIPRKIMLASPYSQPPSVSCSATSDVNVCNYNFLWQLLMIIICHQCTWPVQYEEAYTDIPQAATLLLQSEILQLAFNRKTTTPGHNPILIFLYHSGSVESFHVSSVSMLVHINEQFPMLIQNLCFSCIPQTLALPNFRPFGFW